MKELGIAITLVSFILLSGCKDKTEPERQVVAVEKVGVDNVEIYGGIRRADPGERIRRGESPRGRLLGTDAFRGRKARETEPAPFQNKQ